MRKKLAVGGLAVAVGFLLATNPVVVNAAGQITGAQIKNNSVASKDIKNNSLKGGDVKDASLTGADIAETSLGTVPSATTAGTAGTVGTLAPAAIQDKAGLLFATIEPAGAGPTVKRARGVVGVERVGTGFYDVHFNRDVSGCTWMASYGKTGTGIDPKFATTRASSSAHVGDPTWMGVVIWSDAGAQADGDGFSVSALCP